MTLAVSLRIKCIVAALHRSWPTWHILTGGVNAPICGTIGFPAGFQFSEPWF